MVVFSVRFGSVVALVLWSCAARVVFVGANETIGVYWGQNGNEGSLDKACDSRLYSIVTLAYLTTFGNGRNPVLNLAGHCNPNSGGCQNMASSITRCQSMGIKVMLSIGGGVGDYSLTSSADALNVSSYLWNNFLGGTGKLRPLGNASLDGINFDIQQSSASSPYWYDLAESLFNYGQRGRGGREVYYLAASPQCPFPDASIGNALNSTFFDYVWVQFYGNPSCQYSSTSSENLVRSWNKWTSLMTNATIFLGLVASPFASSSGGYIPPDVLVTQILPNISESRKYGGLILWSKYYDDQNGYSQAITAHSTNTTNKTDTNVVPYFPNALAPVPVPTPDDQSNTALIAGATAGAMFMLLLIAVVTLYLRRHPNVLLGTFWTIVCGNGKNQTREDLTMKDFLVPGLPTRFSYLALVAATNNFADKLGEGGYGSVFAGTLSDGTRIAVKCLDGVGPIKKSFLAEVETIGSIHHINLVRLVGYCTENSRAMLVYEFMPNGSLDKWIFSKEVDESLAWAVRKGIIMDIAKGLVYLHEECRQKIAHLDIKPQNILLDENFNAKVADFGLSKLMDRGQNMVVVSSMRGTIGYLAPDWLGSMITEKVDVYSFGVVVLEIMCGRRNLDNSQPEESMHLLSLLRLKIEENRVIELVDKTSQDMISHAEEVVKMIMLATWCLQNDVGKRPSMSSVVKVLEGVMEVQDELDYDFFRPPQTGFTSQKLVNLHSTPALPSILSGPR